VTKLNTYKQTRRFLITSFLQLRESDLFVPPWRDASPSSHSSFCEEVFSRTFLEQPSRLRPWSVHRQGCLCHDGTNEVDRTNILAPGLSFFPPSPPMPSGIGPGEVVSSYSS